MERYFHFDKSRKILLDIKSKEVSGSAIIHGSLSTSRSQLFVGAWQDYLKKVWVIKLTIFVRVEEFHHKVAIGLVNVHVSVVSHEVYNIHWCDKPILVSIDPAE